MLMSLELSRWALAISAILLLPPSAFGQQSSTSVVLGSCNIVQQQITVTNGSTVIAQNDCFPLSVEESFTVRFVWLRSEAMSLMMAGYFDPSLRPLFGSVQSVVKNQVYTQLDEILRRFGTPVRPQSDSAVGTGSHIIGEGAAPLTVPQSAIPVPVYRMLRLYDGESKILLPDVNALNTIFRTSNWPTDYKLTYFDSESQMSTPLNFRDDPVDAENKIVACALLHKGFSRSSFDNYWNDMDRLERLVAARQYNVSNVTNSSIDGATRPWRREATIRVNAQQNKALQAVQYFATMGWPDDFVIGVGNAVPAGCADARVGFFAQPRRLVTLVAVIESRAPTIEIQNIRYSVDNESALRLLKDGTAIETGPPGAIVLKKGEAAVVPLRLELRYDEQVLPFLSAITLDREPRALHSIISSAPSGVFRLRSPASDYTPEAPKFETLFQKTRAAFRAPEVSRITPTYIFGPSYSLRDITIRGRTLSVRSTPATALFQTGSIEGASCPFLFVSDEYDDDIKIGRILIGAVGSRRNTTEVINLPKGTRSIHIAEQEPEITYLRKVSIRNTATAKEELLATNVEIRPGRSVTFKIPDELQGDTQLFVEGFYIPLDVTASTTP